MNKKIKKILLIGMCLISILGILTGCTVEIPFEFFIISNKNENIVEDAKIYGIELTKNITNESNISRFQDVADTIFNQLGNRDFYKDYYDNPNRYNYILDNYLGSSFYKSIISGSVDNDFKKVIDDIYYNENTLFKKANLIEVGEDVNNFFYDIEIVSVNDEITFNTEIIRLYTDKNFKITSTKIIKELSSVENTTTPLTSESLISLTHTEALNTFDAFLEQMTNKTLFNSFNNNLTVGDTDIQLEALLSNISISNKNTEILKKLFFMGKGDFNNKVLVSYRMDDTDKMGTSVYTYAFSKGDDIEEFDFYYSRVTNELINIMQEKNE